jgi:glycolate oxidase FAD binding subunit
MTHQPVSIDDLQQVVATTPRLSIRGGGTKPGLSALLPNRSIVEMSGLTGVTEHTPEECTFSALAGTPIAEIERLLAPHGQYLPFDPPLADAGATIGGAVAAGASGSCRYRYGGIRDFLIGARIVDGRGRLITAGGKVVKNAAGLLLHQAMVGSCGRFGVLAEVTFKVFPCARARATVKATNGDIAAALATMDAVRHARFELEAIDIDGPSTLILRIGGAADALSTRVNALRQVLGDGSELLEGADDEAEWRRAREFSWAGVDAPLVRVPLTTPLVPALEDVLVRAGATRRYALAGNVAFVSWPRPLDQIHSALNELGLTGQVLIGPPGRRLIGRSNDDEFGRRVATVLDPDGRFGDD